MNKVNCHSQDLDGKLEETKNWNLTSEDKKKVKEFFMDYELGRITGRVGTNPQGSLLIYLYFLIGDSDSTPKRCWNLAALSEPDPTSTCPP
jgi:hypothetical protein